ncbi:MAG TPA: hypothetical protein VHO72_14565 [Bacteroidales bacterium]|nr:hypothetical protein [Bacteroidales bacterium]
MKRKILVLLMSFLAAGVFIFPGCKKDDDEAGLTLPPAETVDMDFSFTQKKSALIGDDTTYYRTARAVVSYWAVKAVVHTALPVYSFKKALENKPVFDAEKNTYTWTYQFAFASDTYEAALTGEIVEDSVDWAMNITRVGGDAAFKYFEGRSAADRSGGWWIIYYPQIGEALKINWTYESEAVGTLRYTNVISGDENKGGYIEFGKHAGTTYDRYFNIHIISNANNPEMNGKTYTIDWSSTNHNGKISDGTGSVCWDNNYVNKAPCE